MKNEKNNNTKIFSFEGQLEDFIRELKKWLINPKIGEISLKVDGVKVSYKRDTKDTVNTAITAKVEEKLKKIICPKIPSWINSDHLTAIGIIGMLITGVGFILGFFDRSWLILIPFGLIMNWFGDSFDGSIARYREKTRPHYGYYIDKVVDALVVFLLALCIGLSGYVKIEIALIFACIYLMLMINVDLIVHVEDKCKNSFGLLGPTEIRIIGIFLAIYMYFSSFTYYSLIGHWFTQYDVIVLAISVVMLGILIVDIITNAIRLNKSDTKDW